MDEQNNKRVPTAEEIARLEAEAAAALRREAGEAPAQESEGQPARPRFVPYVDDVIDAPKPATTAEEAVDDDDDDGEYIPSEWEKRIDKLTPAQWKRWQIIGGAAVGFAAIGSLFIFGQELATYGIVVAVLLAMLLPRYLERAWRRSLNTARSAMLAAMVVGLLVMLLVFGLRTNFTFKPVE